MRCFSDSSNWKNTSGESFVLITSPSGKSIKIQKHFMVYLEAAQKALVYKAIGKTIPNKAFEIELTTEEMLFLLKLSRL